MFPGECSRQKGDCRYFKDQSGNKAECQERLGKTASDSTDACDSLARD